MKRCAFWKLMMQDLDNKYNMLQTYKRGEQIQVFPPAFENFLMHRFSVCSFCPLTSQAFHLHYVFNIGTLSNIQSFLGVLCSLVLNE